MWRATERDDMLLLLRGDPGRDVYPIPTRVDHPSTVTFPPCSQPCPAVSWKQVSTRVVQQWPQGEIYE
jgi:hypothetical protein